MKYLVSILLLVTVACSLSAAVDREYETMKERRSLLFERSWFVTAKEAIALTKTGKGVLVDLCKQNKVKIPGVLRIPGSAIGRNKFLQGKEIILFNEGYGLKRLVSTANRLKKNGIKAVKILKGGLRGWMVAGGAVIGNATAMNALYQMSPAGLFADKDYKGVVVVEVARRNSTASPVSDAIKLPAISRAIQIASVAKDIAARDSTLYVVLSCDENKSRMIQPLVKNAENPVFFINGGIEGYDKWLHKQAAMWRGRKSVRVRQGCPTCN